MGATGVVPIFGQDFERFWNHLTEESTSMLISPIRYVRVLGLDVQMLADSAHVHQDKVTKSPEDERLQLFLQESLRVIRAATDVVGCVEIAVLWFKNDPIPVLNSKTAIDLVSEGRADVVIRYVQSLKAGFNG